MTPSETQQTKIKSLEDCIQLYPGGVPADLVADLMEKAHEDEGNRVWYQATVGKGNYSANDRNCDILSVKNWPDLDHRLFEVLSPLAHEYASQFYGVTITKDEGYCILRYRVGGLHKLHVDHFSSYSRVFGCSIGLNDEYEGGLLSFWDRQKSYKLGAGDILFFPSNFLFPHEVEEVTAGTRYSLITWFN